jgi:hypothetical protein
MTTAHFDSNKPQLFHSFILASSLAMPLARFREANTNAFHSIHIIIIVLLGQGIRVFNVINGFGMIVHLKVSQTKKYVRRQSTSSL